MESESLAGPAQSRSSSCSTATGFPAMISFFAIAISGIVLHFFAVDFTRIITASGIGQEGNPLYYLLGPSNFIAFGFAVVICYYCCMWYVDIPFKYKIIAASCLTSVTAFDFLHDLLYYILTSHV